MSQGRRPHRLPIEPYPIILAATLVVGFMTEVSVSPYAAVRLFLIVVASAAVLTAVASAIAHDRDIGALVAALILVVLLWPGARNATVVIASIPVSLIFIALLVVLLVRLATLMRRTMVRRGIGRPQVSHGFNVFCSIVFVIVLATATISGAVGDAISELAYPRRGLEALDQPASRAADAEDPDIFVILLDGHPRADTFARVLGGHEDEFLTAMQARGFDVATHNRSNYTMTPLTLSSMFGMRPLEDIPQVHRLFDDEARFGTAIRSAINQSEGFEFLRARGYRIVSVASGFEQVRIDGVDAVLDRGSPNEFEIIFIGRSLLGSVVDALLPELFPDSARDRVQWALGQPAAIASAPRQTPILAYIHVPSPHAPIIFAADGSPVATSIGGFYDDAPRGGPDVEARFREDLRQQVEWIDDATLQTIDDLDKALGTSDRPAVTIVMSDHGTGVGYGGLDVTQTDVDERMTNLFAARTPGHERVFPDDVTPVNILPLLFRAYFGADIPLHADRTFLSPRRMPFEYFEVPNPDATNPVP